MTDDFDASTGSRSGSPRADPAALLRRLRRRAGGDGAGVARWTASGRPAPGRRKIATPSRPAAASQHSARGANPLAARPGHFPARAKSVIYLFMAGGPSQLELFDYKPQLQKYSGQPIPDSFIQGRRFAFMDIFTKEHPKLLGTVRKFARYGQSGAWVSALLPRMAEVVDDLTFVKSVATDVFNHAPAKLFANTGSSQFGRPSMGSWVTYGIGSESADLPGFVVLAIRPARAAGRGGQLGERLSPLDLPGRATARRRRADLEPEHAARASHATASAGPSRRSPPSTRPGSTPPPTPRSQPGSTPTRWRSGCNRAPRS